MASPMAGKVLRSSGSRKPIQDTAALIAGAMAESTAAVIGLVWAKPTISSGPNSPTPTAPSSHTRQLASARPTP
jgi:hypothetical protein